MTLILNCLTPDYAVQVSDRRLVGSHGEVFDDSSNKAIFVNGHCVFSYTGLAFIDGKTRTDYWFLDALSDAWKHYPDGNLTTTAEYVAERATSTIALTCCPSEYKQLAFVGVGWGRLRGDHDLRPVYTIVSNSHTPDGKWTAEIHAHFTVLHFSPPEEKAVILVADGQPLGGRLRSSLLRQIESCVRKDTGPGAIARLLVGAARTVAAANPKVGKDLLVNSIPKSAVRIGRTALLGAHPRKNAATFTYVPEETLVPTQYGPHVFAHGVSCRDFIAQMRRDT